MIFNLSAAKALLGAAVVAGAVSAIALPASAISVNTGGTALAGNGQVSSKSGVTTLDFNSDALGERTGGGKVVIGSTGVNASPPGDTSQYLTIGSSQLPNGSPKLPDFATFDLGGDKGYFGLFVGSLDGFNSIEFILNGASKLVLSGVQIAGLTGTPVTGDQSVGVYYNFFGDSNSDLFDTVVLGSSGIAFEVDNIAYREAIPTPALLPGLIGLGVAAWRKRKGQAAEQAEA